MVPLTHNLLSTIYPDYDVFEITPGRALTYVATLPKMPYSLRCEVKAMTQTDCTRLTNLSTILVATDLSDLHRLTPFAFHMAEVMSARLILFHVIPFNSGFSADALGMPYVDRENALACAMNMLRPWCERARKLGLRCEAVVRDNHPVAEEIIAAVDQFRADRLLLGTRTRGRLGRLFLGSVAEQVLRLVDLPVFTIGPEAHLPSKGKNRQPVVLFATSLGDGHQYGAALACQIAGRERAKLIMLHVLPPLVEESAARGTNVLYSSTLEEMKQLANRVTAGSCRHVEVKVLYGDPALEILAVAASSQADLIVMNTNERTGFHNIIHDRTICRVLAHAQCPVVTLHQRTMRMQKPETEPLAVHT